MHLAVHYKFSGIYIITYKNMSEAVDIDKIDFEDEYDKTDSIDDANR